MLVTVDHFLRKIVGDRRFDGLSGGHLQSRKSEIVRNSQPIYRTGLLRHACVWLWEVCGLSVFVIGIVRVGVLSSRSFYVLNKYFESIGNCCYRFSGSGSQLVNQLSNVSRCF